MAHLGGCRCCLSGCTVADGRGSAVSGGCAGRLAGPGASVTLGGTPIGREVWGERWSGYPGGGRHTGWRCRLVRTQAKVSAPG